MLKSLSLVLSYSKHFKLISPLFFLIPFSSSAQQVSKNNASGGWSTSTSWEAATSTWDTGTPLTTGIAQNVTIYGHISTTASIDFGGAGGNLIVNDTLVVNGN